MNKKIRVAIIGAGNCASSLVQGVQFYKEAKEDEFGPGLMHVNLGGYHIRDIEFTAAFDVNHTKVGKDLSQAIFAEPNNTIKFSDVPHLGVKVHRGMTHDGLGKYLDEVIVKAPGPTDDIVGILKATKTDVVINYLPVGSEMATKWYVEQVIEAGCAFINCIPVFIASQKYWQKRFEKAGLPVIGDDIKSQVGATITHRVLTNLFRERGVRLDRTYQLNFGGNTDFMNMLERERLESKKISKTKAVTSQLNYGLSNQNCHVGPSDYVPWLSDRKWCYIRMEGTTFGNVPLNCEVKLEVWDSPNSAGVVIDAVRCAKLALDRGMSGALTAPSSYFMKSPPLQYTDYEAQELTEAFIRGRQPRNIKPRRSIKTDEPNVGISLTQTPRSPEPVRVRPERTVPRAKRQTQAAAEVRVPISSRRSRRSDLVEPAKN
jgi:myo-inositol-1-phosphate synthase